MKKNCRKDTEKKATAFVFSHCHWDIEWYLPFRSYRFWLVQLMDRLFGPVMKDSTFRTYVLDGQVAPLEHYLELHPERERDARKAVARGKLRIGPFYTQFDEWLTSPESIVRNCLWGDRCSRRFGRPMKAGYLPDNFGHPLQMPQILAGFGLKGLIFMRGMPDRPENVKDQFWWRGLDGTEALALHMVNTYTNALNLGAEPRWAPQIFRSAPYGEHYFSPEPMHRAARNFNSDAAVRDLVAAAREAAPGCPTGVVPVANGSDHTPAQENIGRFIRLANAAQDDFNFVAGDCEELVGLIEKSGARLPVFAEELWGSRFQLLLSGTLSTRTYIKQLNFGAEALLEKYAEPLAALADLRASRRWPSSMLREAWRLMLHCQAHDGIHGSSCDAVHDEMVQRFAAARQIATGVAHESLQALARKLRPWPHKSHTPILVFNPVRTGDVPPAIDVWAKLPEGGFNIIDRDGNLCPVQEIENRYADQKPSKGSQCPAWPGSTHLLVSAAVPSFGLSELAIVPGSPKETAGGFGRLSDSSMENEFLRVAFKEGALEVHDKVLGRTWKGLAVIEDEADGGDAWDFSRPWEPCKIIRSTDSRSKSRLVERGPVRATLRQEIRMRVPARLEGERRSRETVDQTVTLEASLVRGCRRVDLSVSFQNSALDHRVRFICPTGLNSRTVLSQGHFGVLERPLRHPSKGEGWAQPPPECWPFREWVAVTDGRAGLAVAAKGLYEYESCREEGGVSLKMTLLRGIGRMSREKLRSRESLTSPSTPIPGAQCAGFRQFEVSLVPYRAEKDSTTPFLSEVQSFLFPPIAHIVDDASGVGKEGAPFDVPFARVAPDNLVLSAFSRSADDDGWILRFWENEGRTVEAEVEANFDFGNAWIVNLNEEPIRRLAVKGGRTSLRVKPYQIVTLKFASGRRRRAGRA